MQGAGNSPARPVSPLEMERQAQELISRRALEEAGELTARLRDQFPGRVGGWVLGAQIAQSANDIGLMHELACVAEADHPERTDVQFLMADLMIVSGRIADALHRLGIIAQSGNLSRTECELLGAKWLQLGQFQRVLDAGNQLQSLSGGWQAGKSLTATALTALGRLDEAEKVYTEIIDSAPRNVDSWYMRSTLRRSTTKNNRIPETLARLALEAPGAPGRVPLHYALAKEFEDVGDAASAFEHLSEGAAMRRRRLSYNVTSDVDAMLQIASVFGEDWAARTQTAANDAAPIFVIGLPRSGTTLVDRILSSHSMVASLGEVNDLAYAVTCAAGPQPNREATIRAASQSDMQNLGERYTRAVAGYGPAAAHLLDKTPANFLYAGLIAKALPKARIVHLRRNPIASGHAMLKTLFRMGYPFSYDQSDLGRYIAAYRRLMAHWHSIFPGRILDVEYEMLVTEPKEQTQRLLRYVALPWEDACLNFHQNAAPTATASAAQVREPIHARSTELWRAYETQLGPLIDTLKGKGVTC
jgi:tetratricopeptide (TPR) repeat protein